ncbi:hypothetical protein CBL_00255 [Carabus blaptoides fortunei]
MEMQQMRKTKLHSNNNAKFDRSSSSTKNSSTNIHYHIMDQLSYVKGKPSAITAETIATTVVIGDTCTGQRWVNHSVEEQPSANKAYRCTRTFSLLFIINGICPCQTQ